MAPKAAVAVAVAGVGAILCISSSVAAMMMGDEEEDKTGQVCTPKGTPDANATYKYGANDTCAMSCKTGYVKEDGACVETKLDDKKKKKDSDDEDAAPDAPPSDPYRVEAGIDYPGSDIFHYWPGGAIKATKDVCLDKCTELPACKLVTFNNAETLCWGKSAANNKKTHGDRNNYFKN